MAQAAHKVTAGMVKTLNGRMAELGSDYFFSLKPNGTLTYFRRYEGRAEGYSVARSEMETSLMYDHKTSLDVLVDEAARACLPEVTA